VKNKKLMTLALVLIIMTATSLASAQEKTSGFLDLETNYADLESWLYADAGISHQVDDKHGVFAFFLVMGSWAEAYAGPTWSPNEVVSLGMYVGGEQGPEGFKPRYAASLWTGEGALSFSAGLEVNNDSFRGDDSGIWYQLDFRYRVNRWLTVGLKNRRPHGVGPAVELKLLNELAFYTSWMPIASEKADWQPKMLIFGIHASL